MVERKKLGCSWSLFGYPIRRQVVVTFQTNWPSGLPKLQVRPWWYSWVFKQPREQPSRSPNPPHWGI